jgi:GNAT superfamily N-acetyltransferase
MEGSRSTGVAPLDLEIRPLSPDYLDDFLYFFDAVGFTDNPGWASCFCRYYHFTGTREDWAAAAGKENRDAVAKLIRDGVMRGYLAYHDGKPAGWCNANSKEYFPLLKQFPDLGTPEEPLTTAIVCYVISPALRRRGVARALLARVIADCALKTAGNAAVGAGPRFIEAYPRKGGDSDAAHYHGHPAMYEDAGFTVYRELNDFFIVRREVAAS